MDARERRTYSSGSSRRSAAGSRPAIAAGPRRDDEPARERSIEVRSRDRREGLIGALENPLRADVDPRPGGHLSVHRQPGILEPAEFVPGRPARDDERVRDEHARRPLMRAEDTHGLAGLHEQGLVILKPRERLKDAVERGPRPCRAPGAAVDDEVFWTLGNVRVEAVLDHAERGLLRPGEAVQGSPARGADDAGWNGHGFNCPSPASVTSA